MSEVTGIIVNGLPMTKKRTQISVTNNPPSLSINTMEGGREGEGKVGLLLRISR